MRTFSCFTVAPQGSEPRVSVIFAADEARARELARRELRRTAGAGSLEIRENGKRLWMETIGPEAPAAPAGRLVRGLGRGRHRR